MALVTWTPKMSVGISKIDKEHQGLLDIMNQLHEGMLQGKSKNVIGASLNSLNDFARVHFGDEESLLRLHKFPGLADHLKLHETFRQKLADLNGQFKAGTAAIAVGTLDFLREWLSKHILVVDAQYKDFLAAKGVS
jgi:hemerythrin